MAGIVHVKEVVQHQIGQDNAELWFLNEVGMNCTFGIDHQPTKFKKITIVSRKLIRQLRHSRMFSFECI